MVIAAARNRHQADGFLVERGICADTNEVFRRYLVEGKPGFVPHRWATLRDAVRWLADDAREGRGIGTKGLEEASRWLADRFREAGAEPAGQDGGWFQSFDVPVDVEVLPSTWVTVDGDGDFVIFWNSQYQDGSLYGVYGQRYEVSGREQERLGLLAALKIEPYEAGVVLPHEQTFPKHKEDRFRLLSTRQRDIPDRQRTLTAVIAWVVFKENADRRIVLGPSRRGVARHPGELEMQVGEMALSRFAREAVVGGDGKRGEVARAKFRVARLQGVMQREAQRIEARAREGPSRTGGGTWR